MCRMIDADAFDKRIRLAVGSCEEELTEDFKDGISTILEMMKTAPTVDAVPVKHGRWIYHPDWQADGECGYECSECGMGSDVDYPYCMLCGARIEREGR